MADNEIPEALKNEIADGMAISWDVPIEMDDGLVLRADVYKPTEEGQYPVIASYGPYAKNLSSAILLISQDIEEPFSWGERELASASV